MKKIPAVGQILIVEPLLNDTHFSRSVILLTECEDDGVVGHIINQQSILQLCDVIQHIDNKKLNLHNGGPVETDSLFFIHKCYAKLKSGKHITGDMYWGGDLDEVQRLITQHEISNHEIKFFLGYSGWDMQQFLSELNEKSWIVTNKFDTDFLFKNFSTEEYWKAAIQNLGSNYAHLKNFPIHPSLN